MSFGFISSVQSELDLLKCAICSNTLEDPVMLTCLHSACNSCTSQATDVTCTTCKVTTDTSVAKSNILVAGLVHQADILKRVNSCTACTDDGKSNEPSVVWCHSCQLALCEDCDKSHARLNKRHEVIPINDSTALSELCRIPLRFCESHREEITLACFTCEEGRCRKCAHGCYTSCHSVVLLDDPAGVAHMIGVKSEAVRLLSDLNSTSIPLDTNLNLPDAVAVARQKSINTLRNAKKEAIDSITKSYESAESSLLECWETLESKAVQLRESAENLRARLYWTNQYCQVALKTDDIAGLLPQVKTLCSSLCNLLEQAKQVKEPTEPLKLVRMDVRSPSEMDLIAANLWSLPMLVSDDFCSSQCIVLSEDKSLCNFWEAPSKPLSFADTPQGTFKGPGSCMDIAVTPHGRLLVAATIDGLKEYDATDFREIATWMPPLDLIGSECVFVRTVCALDDGRAVVGLDPNLVVLLRRDDQSDGNWVIDKSSKRTNETKDSDVDRGTGDDEGNDYEEDRAYGNDNDGGGSEGDIDGRGEMESGSDTTRIENEGSTNGACIKSNNGDEETLGSDEEEICEEVNYEEKNYSHIIRVAGGGFKNGGNYSRSGSDNNDGDCDNVKSLNSTHIEIWLLRGFKVFELQAPSFQLSVFGNQLLAALESRYDDDTDSWCCGPDLVLICLHSGEDLLSIELDYDCNSVALTDCLVVVASAEMVKMSKEGYSEDDSIYSYVVDCYSHAGVRLWRHAVGVDVASLCSDSIARVLYVAANRSIVAVSVDSGRVVSRALTVSYKDAERTFGLALDRSTRRFLAVIRWDGEEPNTVTVHFAL